MEDKAESQLIYIWKERFTPSKYQCPQCGQLVLNDNWPPDYWSGNGSFSMAGEGVMEVKGSQKCVCLPCKIAFRVFIREVWRGDSVQNSEMGHSEIVPLVERDGFLLTPHDVWREGYKAEHGAYPQEVYA